MTMKIKLARGSFGTAQHVAFEHTAANAIARIRLEIAAILLHRRIEQKELVRGNPALPCHLRTGVVVDASRATRIIITINFPHLRAGTVTIIFFWLRRKFKGSTSRVFAPGPGLAFITSRCGIGEECEGEENNAQPYESDAEGGSHVCGRRWMVIGVS